MLTKTQTKLVIDAVRNGGSGSIETFYHKSKTHGVRERNALFKLEKNGIVEIVSRQSCYDSGRYVGGYFVYRVL